MKKSPERLKTGQTVTVLDLSLKSLLFSVLIKTHGNNWSKCSFYLFVKLGKLTDRFPLMQREFSRERISNTSFIFFGGHCSSVNIFSF